MLNRKALLTFLILALLYSCTQTRLSLDDIEDPKDESILDILKKPNLKVLDIGNSYTDDATALLPLVVKHSGVTLNDVVLCKLVRGGASFMDWCNVHDNIDKKSYSFKRIIGDLEIPLSPEKSGAGDGSLMRRVLSEVEWDIIIIHQVSTYAPYYSLWNKLDSCGYLDTFLGIIKKYRPESEIGFLLVHSYWDQYKGNKEHSSLLRWQKIADSARQLQVDYGIRFIIPYGTAIENLRSSEVNNEYDLTRDGTHCGIGLCQYTAACCYYESLICPRTGVSCLGNTSRFNASQTKSEFPVISVTDNNARIAQVAAIMAIKDMTHCKAPDRND